MSKDTTFSDMFTSTTEDIEVIGRKAGLEGKVLVTFVAFFSLRFGTNHKAKSYVQEWADRFKGGEPEYFMDNESLGIYKRVR